MGYYSYVSSIVIDGDLDFMNEYSHRDPWSYQLCFDENGNIRSQWYTPKGRVANKFSVGPSILWSPFFMLAHTFVSLHNVIQPEDPISADGFSRPYLLLCAIGTAFYGFIGLLLCHQMAKKLFGRIPALVAVLVVWFASSLTVYMYFLPFLSHAFSVFACSLFIMLWWGAYEERRVRDWMLLGLVAGFMFATYYVNLIFFVFIAFDFFKMLKAREIKASITGVLVFALFSIAGAIPHFATRYIIYGSPIAAGYTAKWFFTSPRLIKVLFSSEHGLWTWTPVLLLACLGLIPLFHRCKSIGWRSITVSLAFWYVIASFQTWHGISSFGNRYFISLTPIFVLGLAAGMNYILHSNALGILSQRLKLSLIAAIVTILILWNFGFIFQWGTGMIPNRGPISWRTMIHNQFVAVPGRAAHMMAGFFTSRAKAIQEIETEDIEEIKQYRLGR